MVMSPLISLLFGAVLLVSLNPHQVGALSSLDNYDNYYSSRIQRRSENSPSADEIAYQHFLNKINEINEEERKEREEKYVKLPEGWKQNQKTQKRAAQKQGYALENRDQVYNEFLNLVEKQDAEDQKRYDAYAKAKQQLEEY